MKGRPVPETGRDKPGAMGSDIQNFIFIYLFIYYYYLFISHVHNKKKRKKKERIQRTDALHVARETRAMGVLSRGFGWVSALVPRPASSPRSPPLPPGLEWVEPRSSNLRALAAPGAQAAGAWLDAGCSLQLFCSQFPFFK